MTPDALPAVGSRWKTRDGKVIRVDMWVLPHDPKDQPWAHCMIVNPQKGRQRRTSFRWSAFGSSLSPVKEEENA